MRELNFVLVENAENLSPQSDIKVHQGCTTEIIGIFNEKVCIPKKKEKKKLEYSI